MQQEEWKPIKGYEGLYEVSNHGNIRSITHPIKSSNNGIEYIKVVKGKFMTLFKDKEGYLFTCIRKDKKQINIKVHRAVADAFIPNPLNLEIVNHIDGDKSNNYQDNLEWCTQKQNNDHAIKTGLRKCKKVRCIETGQIWSSISMAAEELSCHRVSVRNQILGKQPSLKGLHFEYVK